MIKNIIFDIGNVLVDFHPGEAMREIGIEEEKIPALLEATVGSRWWTELDRGVMAERDVLDKMIEEAPAYRAELSRFFNECADMLVRPFPYSEDWIRTLQGRGLKVYLLSNYPAGYFERHSRDFMPFVQYVDGMVVSAQVKRIKPDPAIYECLLTKYRLVPEECIFIDDVQANVDAARAFGIHGMRFTGYEEIRAGIEELLAD